MFDPWIVIKELPQKLTYLGASPKAKAFVGHTSKSNLISKIVGKKCSYTVTEINEKERVRQSFETKLISLCRISIDGHEWRDSSAEDFRKLYEKKADCNVLLEIDKSIRPKSLLRDLAVVEGDIGQTNIGEAVPITLELMCGQFPIGENDRLMIKRGFLRLELGDAESSKKTWLGKEGEPYEQERKNYAIVAIPSDRHEPRWEVWTEKERLAYVLPDESFCAVEGLEHGDTITAIFETDLKDQYFNTESGESFSAVKQAFLTRISQKMVLPEEEERVALCEHELRFRERKTTKGDNNES